MLINKNGEILLVDYVRKTLESKNKYADNLKHFLNEN